MNPIEAAEELKHRFSKEPAEFVEFAMRFFSSLPGGDRAEDAGYEPYPWLGWKEASLIADLYTAIQDKEDVEDALSILLGDDEDEDEDEDEEDW